MADSTTVQETAGEKVCHGSVSTATVSKLGHLIPENAPVVDIKDIMMYKDNMEEMSTKNLIPYVIYLDEQFKDIVKKKKRDDVVLLVLKMVFIAMAIILLVWMGMKLVNALFPS